MTAPEPLPHGIVEVVRKWHTPAPLQIAQGWPIVFRLAQRLAPGFDAPVPNPPKWGNRVDWGTGGYQDELETAARPYGWKAFCSESFSGPAEIFYRWDWGVSAKGLPAGWTLEFAATGNNSAPGSECVLTVRGPAADVEALLLEAQSAMQPHQ